jgi:hypothetical protein
MESHDWSTEFRRVYEAANARYLAGERQPAKLFNPQETKFLASIGCSAQELFDFIDDRHRYGEPSFEGIEWLPRLIPKARAKLRGEMPPDLMYGCGGDRPFLRGMNMDLPEFLHAVWRFGDDDRKIIDYVKKRRDAARQ